MKTFLFRRLHQRELVYRKLFYRSVLILLLMLFTSYFAEARVNFDSGAVKILVLDKENNEAIPFSNVVAYQNGVQVAVTSTNIDGECIMKNLPPGKYDIKAVYVGYRAEEIKKVDVAAGKANFITIKLNGGDAFITCCFSCCCDCYSDNTENWWPKLWTPYREWYAQWKEKKKVKQVQPKKNKIDKEPEILAIKDSISPARVREPEPIARQIKIFPNPCSDVLHIESAAPLQNLILMDETGKIVQEETMQSSTANIKMNDFANGIYYLSYVLNGKSESEKIVVITK